jgi:hypothetical protein
MRNLYLGISLLALLAPAAVQAQGMGGMDEPATSGQVSPGLYRVFFGFDEATLTPDGRQVVAQAAEEYRRTGQARISVTGHADTSGPADYNQGLSERRAEAVASELVRLGVPSSAIITVGQGESNPLVPTGDGVREPRNRRVEIELPQAPAEPAPAPVAAAPEPAPPMEEVEQPKRFAFTLGPVYGHNFGESDRDGDDDTQNDLIGAELTFVALPGFLGGVSLKQSVVWPFNAINEGVSGRTVVGLNLAPDLGIAFRPFLGLNAGGVYGEGFQDGFVVGPEIGFGIGIGGFTTRLKLAYDYQFRNQEDWDQGIAWAGLDLGIRF